VSADDTDAVVAAFHELYYGSRDRTWRNTRWLGRRAAKCPLDLWVYQEILFETRPDVVIETGTMDGGSALFLASVLELLGAGRVISVDIEERSGRPGHERIRYVTGSSTDPATIDTVRAEVVDGDSALVILDSDHSRNHVLAELRAYSPLVSPGNYLVVEDTNVNGNPVRPDFGPGPMEAVDLFLAESRDFELDREREKFFMTFNPRGYLRRKT
jgi:cephalosporin hydroxylase